jgi:hypothetical protein
MLKSAMGFQKKEKKERTYEVFKKNGHMKVQEENIYSHVLKSSK